MSPIDRPGDVDLDRLRNRCRERLDVDLADGLVDDAALLGAGRRPRRRAARSATIAWMATFRLTRTKSTCVVSPRTGWCWESLRTAGVDLPSSVSSTTAPAACSAWRSSRASTANVSGLALAAVQDAGDEALAAQTARGTRALGRARRDGERGGLRIGHERRSMVADRSDSRGGRAELRRRPEQPLHVEERRLLGAVRTSRGPSRGSAASAAGRRRPSSGARGTPAAPSRSRRTATAWSRRRRGGSSRSPAGRRTSRAPRAGRRGWPRPRTR